MIHFLLFGKNSCFFYITPKKTKKTIILSDINIGGDVDHDWRAPADILSRLHAHATIDQSRLINDVTRHVADGED